MDGKVSDTMDGVFRSEGEDHDWLEIPIVSPMRVEGIELTARNDKVILVNTLKKLEIRAGMDAASGTGDVMLTHNKKVGYYEGPAGQGEVVKIKFAFPATVKYITIQRSKTNNGDKLLVINEVKVLKEKYAACPLKGRKFDQQVGVETVGSINDWKECSAKCYEKTSCLYWNWDTSNTCILMEDYVTDVEDAASIAGTRECYDISTTFINIAEKS